MQHRPSSKSEKREVTTPSRIVLTHWNAGVSRPGLASTLLPELAIYPLLYDEVLIREEDLITNRAITGLLAEERNFAVFSEFLRMGLVKLLRLPAEAYPAGRRFDPVRLPISARAEEHQARRTYKGKPWSPTHSEWDLFERLDDVIRQNPSASRYHTPFSRTNSFAEQLGFLLENEAAYRRVSHPLFRHLDGKTTDKFLSFCSSAEAWKRFLRNKGVRKVILGPDAGFYRSAAYQCSEFLPTPRAARRLVESVYAAVYCDRESSEGRYGGNLIEMPYQFESDEQRLEAADAAVKVEVSPTGAAIGLPQSPGIAAALAATRTSEEVKYWRETVEALNAQSSSSLLAERRFRDAWAGVCAVYAEKIALELQQTSRADHAITWLAISIYLAARVGGFSIDYHVMPRFDPQPIQDEAAVQTIHKLSLGLLKSVRAALKIPSIEARLRDSVSARWSKVQLTSPRRKQ